MSASVKSVITIVENETIMGKWGTQLTIFCIDVQHITCVFLIWHMRARAIEIACVSHPGLVYILFTESQEYKYWNVLVAHLFLLSAEITDLLYSCPLDHYFPLDNQSHLVFIVTVTITIITIIIILVFLVLLTLLLLLLFFATNFYYFFWIPIGITEEGYRSCCI